jgi:hypothetical protein
MSKAYSLVGLGALLIVLGGGNTIRADQPTAPQTAPIVMAPANTLPPATEPAPSAAHVSLRAKLFHGPLFSHFKAKSQGCTSDDPDMGCGTCHSEWVFLFGSCCAFYNEPFYYSPWR